MTNERDRCRKSINCLLLKFLLITAPVGAMIDASIDYEVEGHGFHRTIHYRVDFNNFYEENCSIALHLSPDPTIYVNIDELADLWRHGETAACSKGEIDVEIFAENAKQQNITICSSLKPSGNVLSLPLHQRYQMPRHNDKFVNIILPDATLFLGCKKRIKEYAVSKMALCSRCESLSIKWREIPYKIKPNKFVWEVPVGDLADLNIVTYCTLFTVWFGTFILLGTLWYSREDKGDKGD